MLRQARRPLALQEVGGCTAPLPSNLLSNNTGFSYCKPRLNYCAELPLTMHECSELLHNQVIIVAVGFAMDK